MPAASAPIKVNAESDQLITQTAHFLGITKKDVVDRAVREYVDNHRQEIQDGVSAALRQLDGTEASVVRMLTGLSQAQIDAVGGLPK